MNILLATSEAVPFAKTGGLADVCGALPIELANLGHQPVLFMPAYRQVHACAAPIEPTGVVFDIPIGGKTVRGQLLKSQLPGSEVPAYLVQQDDYFNRAELYTEQGTDYKDNCERFVFFCRAVMESVRLLDLSIDVVHCNDWQTCLIPTYIKLGTIPQSRLQHAATLLTIHNMAYQGSFWHWDMLLTGIDWKHYNWREMEAYDRLNLLKAGIVFSDSINTVSPNYAQEIQRHPQGCGLEGVLRHRSGVVSGNTNGVDYNVWNPATDPHLAANYTPGRFRPGKSKCKAALQEDLELPVQPDKPLIGLVGRLADQKGWDLILEVMAQWLKTRPGQWVILGTGQPEYHKALFTLASQYPDKLAVKLTFCDKLAHRIEAASDMFVMPSRFEPCGLNQLYSLKYGTVPIVRQTGGLADTIADTTDESLAAGTATGFTFRSYDAPSLERALGRACEVYSNEPKVWNQIIKTGMQQDWSWNRSAAEYVELYQTTIARRQASDNQ